ncbi:MAG: DnaB-like helicase C-terminal domain-containing protein [Limisphaerales bacterium]
MPEGMKPSLQENLLVMLVWNDTAAQLIRNAVEPNLFTTPVYRDIINRVYDYLDQYKKPPKDNFPDLIEDELESKSGDLYRDILKAVGKTKDSLNETYILNQLSNFVRTQQLKLGIIKAGELIQQGQTLMAEVALEKAMKSRLELFQPGATLADGIKTLERGGPFREAIPLGIPELDRHRLGPARKELHAMIGAKKTGKTWWLLHLAKQAIKARLNVAYVSLEVSEELLTLRMLQSLFSLTLSQGRRVLNVTRFEKDALGRIVEFNKDQLSQGALMDREIVKKLKSRLDFGPLSKRLRIKEFPTGSLSIHGLEAYLDALERMDGFIPDVLAVDYPGIMKLDPKNLRLELMGTTRDLRGIGVDRNMAVAVVGQTNREGAKRNTIAGTDAGEDFSITQTADVVLTYSQTSAEYQLGLARLQVDSSRISRQHFGVMIAQSYELGQFCLDSAPMMDTYWNSIKELSGKPIDDAEE